MKSVIQLLTPIVAKGLRLLDDVKPLERSDLEIRHTILDQGAATIESEYDEALCVPDTIKKAIEAEQSGASAIVIDCMGDPGLNACREAVSIPVLGPSQTAMHIASMLAHRFGFITVLDRLRPMVDSLVAVYGIEGNYASFRAVDIPVLEIEKDIGRLNNALTDQAIHAVKDDGADILILGCTGFMGCAEAMREGLLACELDVPVIDPIPLTIHLADALVRTGLSHSKRTYPMPGAKEIIGFDMPGFTPTS